MKFCAPLSLISGGGREWSPLRRGESATWLYVPGEEFPDETRPQRRRSFRRASSGTRTSSAKSPPPRPPPFSPHLSLSLPPHVPSPPCFFIRRTRSVLVSTCKWLSRTRVPLILLLYIPGKKYEKRGDSDARARLIGSRVRVADERERLVANKLNPIVRDQLLVSTRAISDTLLATLLEGC